MLEIRQFCEHCGKNLPANSIEAKVCSFECTFCSQCVENILLNVCPNCGGGFENRPIRPKAMLMKYPATSHKTVKPINLDSFQELRSKNQNIPAKDR